ncbi:acyl carrier protein [Buchnera aphidicola (Schlechtendalia chinensis)]|uniref:Acyl carrier protein n=1 Tax=Buchnera aphidicola subsp. Schlechtendalia chinensis TaxID=118110 RepID=A0A172WDN9_BUCSC|nr:acyl carrier protein [Buchnera aphidicola]ANF17096.1 acyl carrier protein [Buchnera aphidicola (Schlechtendalia chinensis)]
MKNIEKKIVKIISKQLGFKKEEIHMTSSLNEDLGADSLDTVELIMTIEDKFNIEITDKESENFTTVQSIIDLIKKKF